MSNDDEVIRRLDTLIKLTATQVTSSMKSAAERAVYLSDLGLDRKAVAEITGMTSDAVSARVSEAKKRRQTKEPAQAVPEGRESGGRNKELSPD